MHVLIPVCIVLAIALTLFSAIASDRECRQAKEGPLMSVPMWMTTAGVVNLVVLMAMVIALQSSATSIYTGLFWILLLFNFGWAIFGSVILAEQGPCYSENQDSAIYFTAIFVDVAAYVVPLGAAAFFFFKSSSTTKPSS